MRPPDFSPFAGLYAASRPEYPGELFSFLASQVPRRDAAWDCATGNGQAALGLARHFRRVIATDVSDEQIRHAFAHERITYRVAPSERAGLEDGSVDAVTVAAAVHWFDLDAFYREVRRVTRPGGILAVWSYHVARVEAPFAALLWRLYDETLRSHFAPQARQVDDRYERLELPGEELPAPGFHARARWGHAQVMDFVRSWSGTQACLRSEGESFLEAFGRELERWLPAEGEPMELRFPIYLRACQV